MNFDSLVGCALNVNTGDRPALFLLRYEERKDARHLSYLDHLQGANTTSSYDRPSATERVALTLRGPGGSTEGISACNEVGE